MGAGIAVLDAPHYPASEDNELRVLPAPYVVYRSERLKVDRDGIAANLFKSDRWRLNASFAGGLPADSDDVDIRDGMPDFGWLGEVGPALTWRAAESGDWRAELSLPLRAAFELEGTSVQHIGWAASPTASLRKRTALHTLNFSLSYLHADRDYQSYFYEVAPRFARVGRPAYEADAGELGWRSTVSFSRKFGRWRLGGFVRYENYATAANVDSPLHLDDDSLSVGALLAWVFKTGK